METVPYLDLRAQYRPLRSEVLRAFEEICESTGFAQGPATSEFEAKFAAHCGVDHCVSLNSGTSALHLALRCLDVGPGDEVVTVSMTFIATAWAISYVGATPVFVDIDPVRRTLSNSKLRNMSTRGSVGTGDNVLISGFIVGDVASATVVVRALGPSLASYGVSGVLSDPTLTIYDSSGSAIASNDNWLDDVNWIDVRKNALSPPDQRLNRHSCFTCLQEHIPRSCAEPTALQAMP